MNSQVLFSDGKFQWKRLENLIALAREGAGGGTLPKDTSARPSGTSSTSRGSGGLDLSDTVKDALKVLLIDEKLRTQVGGRFFNVLHDFVQPEDYQEP